MMTERLERCFLPLDRRNPPESYFFRVIGRDRAGKAAALLDRYAALAQERGACFREGIPNPGERETARFFEVTGPQFTITQPLVERHMTIWLGQLRPAQRKTLSGVMLESLDLLRSQGSNESIVRNTYIKFMCWLRAPLGRVLSGLGRPEPPKLLLEGGISRYEALMLRLLHRSGCDVWYVHPSSEEAYQKADPGGRYSQLVQGEVLGPAPEPDRGTKGNSSSAPAPPPAWAGMEGEVVLNGWAGDRPVWEAVLLPAAQRGSQAVPKLRVLLAACFGAEERSDYRNRLFHLERGLEGSGRTWILLDQKLAAPTAAETAPFLQIDRKVSRTILVRALAERLNPACGRVRRLLAQRAFTQVMDQHPVRDLGRTFNHGVRLACWLARYGEKLFASPGGEQPPALIYYGSATEAEISLLWALAQMGADVLYICPVLEARTEFSRHFLAQDWAETVLEGSLPLEPFPQREERVRTGTTAYNASKDLDKLLYSDTGMFRDRQFARSQPVTLRTTYDEVGQLWPEEAQYRPSFQTRDGVVYVPNLFTKISGVDKGDLNLYWDNIRSMITGDTWLITEVPFLKAGGPSMSMAQANAYLHDGRLDPKALKASRFYRYDYLPDDTQDYILEKIQALIDYDLIINGGPDLPAAMLPVLMNLDKELLRLLQRFDFTRSIPKLLIVDVTERLFSLEECILLAFLNLTGFDIAVFTPTGYRNLEKHIRPDSFDALVAGEFRFDLTVPDLRRPGKSGWLDRLFGGA